MSHDDDARWIAELARALPAVDLPAASAARIAERARRHAGRTPSPWRLVEPAIASALTTSYLLWAIARVLDGLS